MNSYGNSFLCFGCNICFFFVLIVDEDCSKMIIFFIHDCNSFKVEEGRRSKEGNEVMCVRCESSPDVPVACSSYFSSSVTRAKITIFSFLRTTFDA